jgi:hypothetical protein
MTREYAQAPTTKAAQKQPQKMWKTHPAFWDGGKFGGPNLRPKTQSTQPGIRICRMLHLRIPVSSVNVTIAFRPR